MTVSAEKSWRCISASVRGSGHVKQNLPCQDAHATAVLDDGTLIVAVADGAGSSKRSAEGAHCSVETCLRYLADRLKSQDLIVSTDCELVLKDAVKQARGAVEALASGDSLKDFATTLLLAVITNRWLFTVQVGDGAVVCRNTSGPLQVLSQLEQSE